MEIQITLPNKKQKKFNFSPDGLNIIKSLTQSEKNYIAIEINNEIFDLNTKIEQNSNVRLITENDPEGLEIMRHSASHIMAQAILQIYPNAKLTIGPVIKDGFYYDIDMEPLSKEDFPKIESLMKKIIKKKSPIVKKTISKTDALTLYKNEPYKLEIISNLKNETISLYEHDNFIDLCKGPHVPHTGFVKFIKLLRVSGAYWRADQSNKQLQRIYGTAFFNKKSLESYLHLTSEAKKRNHRKIAINMDLLSFHDFAPGIPFLHPNGMIIWNTILDYWRDEHKKAGYIETKTPILLDRKLWEKSGHWENYRNNIYTTHIDNKEFVIKPMNCPGNMIIYKNKPHSYKELPIKFAEIGLVHRHELSGVLNGLFRVRAFHQDDAHIFTTTNDTSNEILNLLKFGEKIYKTFGLEFELELSTKPKKFIGTKEQWNLSTTSLASALKTYGKNFSINTGDGAFYGPKIDFHIKDSLQRTWQCGTIQLDASIPERFNLFYTNKNNEKCRPIVLHRAILGSIERFFGILIEHYAGKFPLWLSPTQVIILPINDNLLSSAEQISQKISKTGIRIKIDTRTESLGKKIRDAQNNKIPLILIHGKKEKESNTITIRTLNGKVTENIEIKTFIETILTHITTKKLELNLFN